MRFIPEVILHRERHELPDGDFLDWFWSPNVDQLASAAPIVLMLHGLVGCPYSSYVQEMQAQVQAQGWRGVTLNFRNCGGITNRMPYSYHAGRWDDVAWTVKQLRTRFPQAKLAVIGFSLGGSVLLNWLGDTFTTAPAAAVAISVPYDLQRCAARLRHGVSRLYEHVFLRELQQDTLRKWDLVAESLPAGSKEEMLSLRSLYEFDSKFTAPLHGFASAEQYYTRCSCRPKLSQIQVPTLLVHGRDDVLMWPDVIPHPEELGPLTQSAFFKRGGHIGFLEYEKDRGQLRSWLSSGVSLFLREVLGEGAEGGTSSP